MVLFFALGVAAALVRSDLSVPEAAAKFLALYLMLAIGFKGGTEVAKSGLDASMGLTILAGIGLSFAIPVIGYTLLRLTTRLGAIDAASVVIAVLDARDGVTDQDASLLGLAAERGRAMVIAVNKWDGLPPDQRDRVRAQLELKLPFVDYAPVQYISALHGTGVGDLFGLVRASHRAAHRDLPTPELTRILQDAVTAHQPPLVRSRRIKLRYAHQGGRNPPVIVVHGSQAELLPDTYRRYLANVFRKAFRLHGTPVRIELRSGDNPYAGRRNPLTPRQQKKRERLMRHVKKRR